MAQFNDNVLAGRSCENATRLQNESLSTMHFKEMECASIKIGLPFGNLPKARTFRRFVSPYHNGSLIDESNSMQNFKNQFPPQTIVSFGIIIALHTQD